MFNGVYVLLMLILLSSLTPGYANDLITPDTDKNYAGSLDKNDTIRKTEGNYQGRYKSDVQKPFTNKGKFSNRFKGGNTFDRSGIYSGKVNPFGHAYDKSGNYSGRIDRFGNVYDRAGNYSGKVKPRP